MDHLLLIRFQVGILSTELDILIQYLPVLTTEHIDGRLKLDISLFRFLRLANHVKMLPIKPPGRANIKKSIRPSISLLCYWLMPMFLSHA
mgnify:CR=1 FL=1